MLARLLRDQALVSPDAPAILAPGKAALTYSALHAAILRCGHFLHRSGISPSDRMVLVCSNGPEMAVAFLGIAAHAACAPLNPAYRANEFEFYLSDLRPAAVVLESGLDSPIRSVASSLGIAVIELSSLYLSGPGVPPDVIAPPPSLGSVALLLHTSGTTSRPKLVPLTQSNLVASARHIAASLRLQPSDRCLNVMPLFHIHGLGAAVLASLASGASVVCCPGFVAPKFFDWVDEFSPTWYTAVPTIHQSVVARAEHHRDVIDRRPFRFIRSCSSALAPSLMDELESIFRVPVVEAYGMTEAAHQMTSNPLPPGERRPGSVGIAAGPEIAIMDQAGALLPADSEGEIVIRGANVTSGYLDNPVANAGAFTGGWFRTGDQGRLDAAGYLCLTSRLKEIINRGGEKIAPREIDEVLLSHPAVAQAVAFSAPHATLGEAVAAAVVTRAGHSVSEEELREYAAARLADFKVPELIVFLPEIPKGPTGKIQRIGLAGKLGIQQIQSLSRPRPPYEPPSSAMERQVASLFEQTLGIERAGIHDSFFDLGGDSILLATLLTAIRESTQAEIMVLQFLACPTVSGVCRILESDQSAVALHGRLHVIVRSGSSNPALFCLPSSDGDLTGFFQLARRLPNDQPIVAFHHPQTAADNSVYRIEDLAARYLEEVLAIQPEGPYHLVGTCTGGFLAYEIARQLSTRGQSVGLLALLDCHNHAWGANATRSERFAYGLRLLRKRYMYQSARLRSAGLGHAPGYLRHWVAATLDTARRRTDEWAHSALLRFGLTLPDRFNNSRLAIRHAAAGYTPRPWPGALDLFRVEEPRVGAYDYPEMGWADLAAGGIRIHEIPGSHLTMLSEPVVQIIASRLQAGIREFRAVVT